MIEAMWQVVFAGRDGTAINSGSGIAVMETGRVLGGDGGFTYIGTYEVKGDEVTARLTVSKFNPEAWSVTGLDHFVLLLEGKVAREKFEMRGRVEGHPGLTFITSLKRVAELP